MGRGRSHTYTGANLELGVSAPGADLNFADLTGANLSGADLRRADLRGADPSVKLTSGSPYYNAEALVHES